MIMTRREDSLVISMLLAVPQKLRIKWLVKKGLRLGRNCYIAPSVIIDPAFPWLISIGDNCYLTYNVMILAHDACTKNYIEYTKIGAVTIGNNCFVGVGSIILPNVHIGENVIIGAGSVVTRDIPSNSVVAGNPAKVINTTQKLIDLHSSRLRSSPHYPKEGWTLRHGITQENKRKMWASVKEEIGYIE
jgi:maltose O-acetyltransferase